MMGCFCYTMQYSCQGSQKLVKDLAISIFLELAGYIVT